jgi:AbrB family looped-hinge helix DNA binding protein
MGITSPGGQTMRMKVFNKGQVVIPAGIRRQLGIDIGDLLEVCVNRKRKAVELRKTETFESDALAGCLSKYEAGKKLPSRKAMDEILRRGLAGER